MMAIVLNRCELCNAPIDVDSIAYFKLNDTTDRFDLECEICHLIEEMEPQSLTL